MGEIGYVLKLVMAFLLPGLLCASVGYIAEGMNWVRFNLPGHYLLIIVLVSFLILGIVFRSVKRQ